MYGQVVSAAKKEEWKLPKSSNLANSMIPKCPCERGEAES